ncbi:MAG: quinone-dependent dihydroorotate dehydrogenase, partial [Trueperaceae bacterium]|nr:quinone-dependent dihydroorotate dehydrogenase [Trueperaceae bacterium]
ALRLGLVPQPGPVSSPRLRTDLAGLPLPNPVGLAAGFDKNGRAAATWPALGFATAELGTVTARPQPGNPKPRVFRLPAERAAINRMGFNNEGADALAARLAAARREPWWPEVAMGVNVGKSRVVALEDAVADYEAALRAAWPVADYLVLNVSSPNTPGLRTLQEAKPLADLLGRAAELKGTLGARPVLLKLSPDLTPTALDEAVALAEDHGIDGLVVTNTTVDRSALAHDPGEAGGLSGAPLGPRALRVLRAVRARTALPLVAVGGIESGAGAVERLEAGATLLQVYTGWIFEGPGLARRLLADVARWAVAEGHPDLGTRLAARDAVHRPARP